MGELSDAVGDVNDTGKEILSAIQGLSALIETSNDELSTMSSQLDDLVSAGGGEGGGGAPTGAAGGGRGGGAGRPKQPSKASGGFGGLQAVLGAARAHPAVAAAVTAAAALAPHVGAGVVSEARGGDFAAGFDSSVNRMVGRVPILGEATGLAGGARIEQATTRRVAQVVAQIEKLGGRVSQEDIGVLLREVGDQELRIEDAHEKVRMQSQQYFASRENAVGDRARLNILGPGSFIQNSEAESAGIGHHR